MGLGLDVCKFMGLGLDALYRCTGVLPLLILWVTHYVGYTVVHTLNLGMYQAFECSCCVLFPYKYSGNVVLSKGSWYNLEVIQRQRISRGFSLFCGHLKFKTVFIAAIEKKYTVWRSFTWVGWLNEVS